MLDKEERDENEMEEGGERNSAMCDTEYLYFSFDRKQKKYNATLQAVAKQ